MCARMLGAFFVETSKCEFIGFLAMGFTGVLPMIYDQFLRTVWRARTVHACVICFAQEHSILVMLRALAGCSFMHGQLEILATDTF